MRRIPNVFQKFVQIIRLRRRLFLLGIIALGASTPLISLAEEPGGLPNVKRVIHDDLNLSLNGESIWGGEPLNYNQTFNTEFHEFYGIDGSLPTPLIGGNASLGVSVDGTVGIDVSAKTETPTLDLNYTGNVESSLTKLDPSNSPNQFGRSTAAYRLNATNNTSEVDINVNQLKWDVSADFVTDLDAHAVAEAEITVNVGIPSINVNPISHLNIPSWVPSRFIPGSWDDPITVGGWSLYSNSFGESAEVFLTNIDGRVELIKLTNEEISLINEVELNAFGSTVKLTDVGSSFDLNDLSGNGDNYIGIVAEVGKKEPEVKVARNKGAFGTQLGGPEYSLGGVELDYDSLPVSTTLTETGTATTLSRSQDPFSVELDLDGLTTLYTEVPFEVSWGLPDIPGVDVSLGSFNVPVVDFGSIGWDDVEVCDPTPLSLGCTTIIPGASWNPPAISIDVNPASILGLPNPWSIGPWTTLEGDFNLLDIDLFQKFGYDESYTVTPNLYASYTFNQTVMIWDGTTFRTVVAGNSISLNLDDALVLEVFPVVDGQDLSQLDFSVEYEVGARVQSNVKFGLSDMGIDVEILSGSVNSSIIPGAPHRFGPLLDHEFGFDLNLDFVNRTEVREIRDPETGEIAFSYSLTHDGATSRYEDFRYLNSGAVVATNPFGNMIAVNGENGANGQSGDLGGDGGHGGYAAAVDASQSSLDTFVYGNFGEFTIRGGDGGNGTNNGLNGFDGDGGNGGDAVGYDLYKLNTLNGATVQNGGVTNVTAGDAGLAGNANAENGFAGEARGVDARESTGKITIINEGTLTAQGGSTTAADRDGGKAIGIDASTAGGVVEVTNSGTIAAQGGSGGQNTGVAAGVLTSDQDDVILNSGDITVQSTEVAIGTFGGNDRITLNDGSDITGLIETGSGDDDVIFHGGVNFTKLDLGTGNDEVEVHATEINSLIDFSAGGDNILRLMGPEAVINVATVGGADDDLLHLLNSGSYSVTLSGFDRIQKDNAGIWNINLIEDVNKITDTTINAGALNMNTAAATWTWSGPITGDGGLIKTGEGTLILFGLNNYTGGTVVDAGILQGVTSSVQGHILNNGTVIFDQVFNCKYLGNMSGTGDFIKRGTGTIRVGGVNTYSGGTLIENGTLIGNSLALQGNIENNAAIIFDQNLNGEYNGDLFGTGTFEKTGDFRLLLSGTNTFTGGTTISAGVLEADTESLLGNITNNAILDFNQEHNADWDGIITGTGSLEKHGRGNVNLTEDHTYTGTTSIYAGRLRINGSITSDTNVSGGILGGSGTIHGNVAVNSTSAITPGNSIGQLNVDGNYSQQTNTLFQAEITNDEVTIDDAPIAGTHNDLLAITGNADLQGGLLNINAGDGSLQLGRTYDPGVVYDVIKTDGSVSGPGFAEHVDNLLLRDFHLLQNEDSVQIKTYRIAGNFEANGTNQNCKNIGRALDVANEYATGGLGVTLDEMLLMTPEERCQALSSLSGDVHGSAPTIGFSNTSQAMQFVNGQIGGGGFGGAGIADTQTQGSNMLASMDHRRKKPQQDASDIQLVTLTDAFDGAVNRPEGEPVLAIRGQTPDVYNANGGWITGYGMGGQINGANGIAGIDYKTGGTSFGYTERIDSETQFGFFGVIGSTTANGGPQTLRSDSYLGGLLFRKDYENVYMVALAAVGFDDLESSRVITVGAAPPSVARAEFDGLTGSAYTEFGYNIKDGAVTLQPLVGLQYTYLYQNGFTESGAAAQNLSVNHFHGQSIRSTVGSRLSWDHYSSNGWVWSPAVRASWLHEYLDTHYVKQNSVGGAPGFAVAGLDTGNDWGVFGAGLSIAPNSAISVFADYEVQANYEQSSHMGTGGIRFNW